MFQYFIRRVLVMIPTLLVISALVFVIIQLPEGDYLTSHIAELEAQGEKLSQEKVAFLRQQYGLDKSVPVRYVTWLGDIVTGDLGTSFQTQLPVSEIIRQKLPKSLLLMVMAEIVALANQFAQGRVVSTLEGGYDLDALARSAMAHLEALAA